MARSYSVDTSALIEAWVRYYPPDIFPTLWEHIEHLVGTDRLLAVDEVLRELERKEDTLFQWAKLRQLLFVPLDTEIQQASARIINLFPSLYDRMSVNR